MSNEYSVTQKTSGYLYYKVQADSEEEALLKVLEGVVDYDCHDYDVDETWVEED